jgi:hypothetical protein
MFVYTSDSMKGHNIQCDFDAFATKISKNVKMIFSKFAIRTLRYNLLTSYNLVEFGHDNRSFTRRAAGTSERVSGVLRIKS